MLVQPCQQVRLVALAQPVSLLEDQRSAGLERQRQPGALHPPDRLLERRPDDAEDAHHGELVTDDEGNDDQQLAEFGATDAVVAELDADQRRLLVEQALCRLPEHQRVPIVLYHFESMSYQQISDLLHVSLPKVKTDIQRARAALAKALGRVGIVRTSLGD